MVQKSQTGVIHKGNIKHREKNHSICKMSSGNRAFSLAFWGLGARGNKPVIVF